MRVPKIDGQTRKLKNTEDEIILRMFTHEGLQRLAEVLYSCKRRRLFETKCGDHDFGFTSSRAFADEVYFTTVRKSLNRSWKL